MIPKAVLLFGLLVYLASCGEKSTANNNATIAEADTTKPSPLVQSSNENAYEGLRNRAFSVSPKELGLPHPKDKVFVYGVIMDWGMDGATVTTVAYQTGDASLYLSTGGGVIGGGQHQNVSTASKQFVSLAQTFIDKAKKTTTTPLPLADEVKFYLLTNKGIYVGQDEMKNFENSSSAWLKLFEEGNKVLTELRITTENK
jgi:predicted Abi (CAAX) family protease